MQISPKCCIVSASLSAAAFALKCKAAQFYVSTRKHLQKQRPKAATYLCRFAAKARFDNRLNYGRGFPKGRGRDPSPFGRFKGKGSLRKGGNRNPPFLKWRSLVTFFRQGKKVTRRRQKKRFGTDRAVRPYTRLPKIHVLFIRADVGIRPYEITGKPVRHPFGAMRSSRPTKRAADECP